MSPELLKLIEQQRIDDAFARVPDRPLEFPAGLNPYALAGSKPRYFRSARKIRRRRRSADVVCGTSAMYKRGCRCESCREQQSLRNKQWRKDRQDGERTATIVAVPVRNFTVPVREAA